MSHGTRWTVLLGLRPEPEWKEEDDDLLLGTENPSGEKKADSQKAKTRASNDKKWITTLDKYGVNLNAQARDGKLDPIYGRDTEIYAHRADIST